MNISMSHYFYLKKKKKKEQALRTLPLKHALDDGRTVDRYYTSGASPQPPK